MNNLIINIPALEGLTVHTAPGCYQISNDDELAIGCVDTTMPETWVTKLKAHGYEFLESRILEPADDVGELLVSHTFQLYIFKKPVKISS